MEAVLLLGGNIGDMPSTFYKAEALVGERVGPILSRSRDHWTEPWGFQDERLFLNRALIVDTQLEAPELMRSCLAIERELGRVRAGGAGYLARTVDLDILFLDDLVMDTAALTLPHPRLHERYFALAPAADVVPDLVHPLLHRSVLDLLNDVIQVA